MYYRTTLCRVYYIIINKTQTHGTVYNIIKFTNTICKLGFDLYQRRLDSFVSHLKT